MLSRKARPELQRARRKLQEWERVPRRAYRFHSTRSELEGRLKTLLERWWMVWIDDDELTRLAETTRRLERIADSLMELNRQAERLEGEVQQLGTAAARIGDDELRDWFGCCCEDRLVRLGRIGVDSDREAELFHEQQEIATIEVWARLHLQGVELLLQAADLHNELASCMAEPAEVLREGLPRLRERILQDGINQDWLAQLRKLLAPVQELVLIIKDPPASLQTVNQLLPDLRGWARRLGMLGHEVQELTQRHQTVTQDWHRLDEASVNEVLEEAQSLGRRLRDRGQEQRRAELRRLEEQKNELVEACGPQPGLEQRIEPLRRCTVRRHQEHAGWLKQCQEAGDYFVSIAETHEIALEKRLHSEISVQSAGLDALHAQPLSDQARADSQRVQHEIDKLRLLRGATGMLQGLQRIKSIRGNIEQLVHQARQEKQELLHRQQALREHNRTLRAQAAQLGLKLTDHRQRISRLWTDGAQLEVVRSAADELASELEEHRHMLLDHCRQHLVRQQEQERKAMLVLGRAGCPAEEPAEPEGMAGTDIDPGSDPQQWVNAVLAGEQRLQEVQALVERTTLLLDQQRLERLTELRAMQIETLPPGEREDAEQLLSELGDGSWAHTDEPVEHLHLLAQLLERCRLHFNKVRSEQLTAANRVQGLRRRLPSFNEDHLRRYCPELTDRVTSLVFGVPEQPGEWGTVKTQLSLAEQLLGRLELQAPRQAVRELESHVRALRRQVQRLTEDDPTLHEAQAVLAELEQLSPHELPSATLRMRVRNLVACPAEIL